jgi:hypothetical protein
VCYKEETEEVHECSELGAVMLAANAPVDDETMELLKKIGKKCPACGMFIEKSEGCASKNCCPPHFSLPMI